MKLHNFIAGGALALSLCLSLGLSACGNSSGTEMSAQEKETQTVSVTLKDNTKLAMDIPASWKVEPQEAGYTQITPDDIDGIIQFGATVSPISNFNNELDALNYWRSLDSSLHDDWKKISDDTTDAERYRATAEMDGGKNAKGVVEIIFTGDQSAGIMLFASGNEWEKAESVFNDILSTLKIENGTKPNFKMSISDSENQGSTTDNQETPSNENQSDAPKSYPSGMYKIGTDMPAGEYKLSSTDHAYWEVTTSSAADADIVGNDNFTGDTYVTVQEGQYFKFERCSATPVE